LAVPNSDLEARSTPDAVRRPSSWRKVDNCTFVTEDADLRIP
jgi:hypothetical protein